jgi:predicted RecA/RadA family phage recombinase
MRLFLNKTVPKITYIMKNKVSKGCVIHYTVAGSAVASGDLVVLEDIAGVATTDGAIGDTIALDVEGVFTLPKVTGSGTAFAQGQAVYYEPTEEKTTPDADDGGSPATAFVLVGYAWAAATTAATTVNVRLKL